MEDGVVARISSWSEGKISDEELIEFVEGSRSAIEGHQTGFREVVDDLNPQQKERCADIISFCFTLMDQIEGLVTTIQESVKAENRGDVMSAGDFIARASYQLNQAFVEFRNLALAALGPTDIPNYNHLLSRRDGYLEEPSENNAVLFQEAIDSERIVVYHALEDLAKEPDHTEVRALINCFREHMTNLNSLAEALEEEGPDGEYEEIFEELEKSFFELQDLVPKVQMKLHSSGATEYPDLNYLLGLLEKATIGGVGEQPLLEALEAVEEHFSESREIFSQSIGAIDSALANDELKAVLKTYEEFDDGIEAVYRFLEEHDTDWLTEARGCLLEFAEKFAQHHKRLKEIEVQQSQVLCPMCATYNETTRNRCAKCGAQLPQNVAATATSTFDAKEKTEEESRPDVIVTPNIAKLYTAVNQVADGSIDHNIFLDEVGRFETLVEANARAMPKEPQAADSETDERVADIYDAFENGVSAFREAIVLFKTFPEKNDEEVLAEGVRLVDEGARLIAQVEEAVTR